MTNGSCTSSFVVGSSVYPIVLNLISILLTSRALQIQYRLRKMFHPFFSLLLSTVLLGYSVCSSLNLISNVLVVIDAPMEIIIISTNFYYSLYSYVSSIMTCLVIERLIATILMKTYEHNRQWWPLVLSQILVIALSIVNFFMSNGMVRAFSTLGLFLLNILFLTILLFVNYRITKALTGSGATLTSRYQITENIRTIRVLLPTMICDALVSIVDVTGMIFFDLDSVFDNARCSEEVYTLAFYVFTTLSAMFEFLVPLSLLFSHPAFRRQSMIIYDRELTRISRSVGHDKTLPKVVNVLGIEITNAGEQAYFENLSRVWNLRL